MKWTKQPPTSPGWYWFRDHLTDEPEFVQVQKDGDGFWVNGLEVGFRANEGDESCEYAGPIPEPED